MRKPFTLIALAAALALIGLACESQEFVSAKMYVQQEELDRAEEFFLKALDVPTETENAQVPFLLARDVYAPQRRYAEMSQMLEEALRRNPTQKLNGVTIDKHVENLRQIEWVKVYKLGADLYNRIIEQMGGETPDEAQREGLQKAKSHFETATQISPSESSAYTNLIHCYRQLRDKEGEHAAIELALKMKPDDGMILLLAGEQAWNDERHDEAVALYERAHEALPDNIGVMQRLANAYLATENPQAAIEVLEDTQRQSPKDPNVFYNIGLVYINIGNDALNRGQASYQQAIASEEVDYEQMAFAAAALKEAQTSYSEALYFMDNTLALNPDDLAATTAIKSIQDTKKILITLQRSAKEMLRQVK